MDEPQIKSAAFREAQLKSERVRVKALLGAFGSLLVMITLRGISSLLQGHRGEAWPFVVLLGTMTVYEMGALRYVNHCAASGREITRRAMKLNMLVEAFLPVMAVFLLTRTTLVGPQRALSSPAVLAPFIFIILSTLHLDPALCRLSGIVSALGYLGVAIYTFTAHPQLFRTGGFAAYTAYLPYGGFLLLGGGVASAVAHQIRQHVIAAMREAETRARIAEMEYDLGIARSIQQGLLPSAPPGVEGFDIAGWNRPAAQTGGDYFDWQQLSDGRVAVTVADVTGHGIGPALCMAACRAYARAGLAAGDGLQTFLCRLNRLLYEDLPAERFVTFATGILNPADGGFELISAGHGPLLFYSRAEDRVYSYDAQGPPLGLLPRIGYRGPHRFEFAQGDILVLVTDGFVEWVNARDEDFGQERVEQAIRAARDKPSAEMISELHASVRAFAGQVPQADDLTALVVKRI